MKRSIAELITRDPEKFAHHDRVFKNNPVVMQGMGLAPLVVLATTGKNALMLAVAVALLLTPSRMLACLVSRLFPLRDEQPAPEELEKKLLPRALVYSGSAAVVYLAAYPILNAVFGTDLLITSIEYSGSVIPLGTLGYFVLYPDSLACIGSLPFPPDSCIIIACNNVT